MKNQKNTHFNVIDIAVLLIIAAVISVTVYGYAAEHAADETTSIVYYLKVRDISQSFSDKIGIGDKIYNHNDGAMLGEVTDIAESSPYNTAYAVTEKEKNVLYISVKAEAEKADKGYLVNGTNISAGNSLEIRFPHLFCKAECVGYENSERFR